MGRGQRERAGAAEVVQDRHAQRAAFFRVGGPAQLVQQHQRIGSDLGSHVANPRDVRREGAQALLDRLVVAHVGQHLVEERELRLRAGHRQAGLRHQRQQAHGLQRDRLAAVVGPADQQRPRVAFQPQRHRHDGLSLAAQHVLEQRMPRIAQ